MEESIDELDKSKEIREAFGNNVIDSFIKLKKEEIINFGKEEIFDKKRAVTDWEKRNTLDC